MATKTLTPEERKAKGLAFAEGMQQRKKAKQEKFSQDVADGKYDDIFKKLKEMNSLQAENV